jgi:Holliday junction resolvase RusA-like endonuclease
MKTNRLHREYQQKFGDIPDTVEERVALIKSEKRWTDKNEQDLLKLKRKLKRVKWKEMEFTIFIEPRPSARPRFTFMGRTYVPHAADNGTFFSDIFMAENPDIPRITTPCYIYADVYALTPKSYNRVDKILYEEKLLENVSRKDIDNYAKSVLDMIQHGLLSNDNLVIDIKGHKYYSIKPRIECVIRYMDEASIKGLYDT